jgi:hypothetical protein
MWLQNTAWVIPASQSVHIASLSVLFASALMLNFRLLTARRGGRKISEISRVALPAIWAAMVFLFITGSIQTIAEPMRQFVAPAFWAKILMIAIVLLLTWMFSREIRRRAEQWDSAASRPKSAVAFSLASTMLWTAIIACGRFIGYTYQLYL